MKEVADNEDYISLKQPTSFIGGAERARRNARKRMYQPRQQPKSNNNKRRYNDNRNTASIISPYPKSMREYERFFGSLLSSSSMALKQSETDGSAHRNVMQQACSLLNVPSLPTPSNLQHELESSNRPNDNNARTHHLMQRSSSLLSTTSNSSSSNTSSASSGTYDNARSYYMSKAPLILEESRCIIADSLMKVSFHNHKRNNNSSGGASTFTLELQSIEEKYPKLANRQRENAPLILNFQIIHTAKGGNQEKSSKWTRPGSVLLLRQQQQQRQCRQQNGIQSSVLACIVPNGNWKSSSSNSNSMLSLMIFRRDDIDLTQSLSSSSSSSEEEDDIQSNGSGGKGNNTVFYATALTTLISQIRQMEACLRMVKVSFMNKLLGHKGATHIRFGDSSEEEEEEEEVVGDVSDVGDVGSGLQEGFYVEEEGVDSLLEEGEEEEDGRGSGSGGSLVGLLAKIPTLNQTQERAARSFLESPKESLILVQGPPGTGKSTFLVNIICRRLANHPTARLLVTAPTNKAVTVLAERFLNVVNEGDDEDNLSSKCNAVLVGVEDKLISQSSSKTNEAEYIISPDTLSSPLRSIFAYTWINSMKNECELLLDAMKSLHSKWQTLDDSCDTTIDTLIAHAEKIKIKISLSIPSERSVCSNVKHLLKQLRATSATALWEDSTQADSDMLDCSASTSQLEKAIVHADDLIETLNEMESSPVQELLATARVIFCTLSTAGASILKQTRRIDDLLIDEAAAATEPEICIPFHLRPQRMLAVGDPLQLPPTIMSRHAADMGLSTSMHERLMNQCGKEFFMLDRQYRMNAQISLFPCNQFYSGKITNGPNVICKTYISNIALPKKSPYSFINIRGGEYQMQPGGSYANEAECIAVVKLVENIARHSAHQVPDWHSTDKLRIITFYQGQVTLLRRLLSKKGLGKVLVATVDSSQGCEADVIIISFVRSSSKKGVRHAAGFLADDRRINVALTRARHQLICVGDATGTLGEQGSVTLKNLVSDAKQRGCLS